MIDDPLLGRLLSDTREVVSRLLDEPLRDPEALRTDLLRYARRFRALDERSLADLRVAEALQRGCGDLLDRWPSLDPRGRRLAQVAVRYFVMEDDGDDDLDSPFGFDDDLEVYNAVAEALGAPPLAGG